MSLLPSSVSLWCFVCEAYAANLDTGKINAVCLPLSEEQNESNSCYPERKANQKLVLWEKVVGRVAVQLQKSLLPEMSHSLIFLLSLQQGHLVMHIPNRLDLEVFGQGRL